MRMMAMRTVMMDTVMMAGSLVLSLAVPVLVQAAEAPRGPDFYGPHVFGPHPFGPWMWAAGLFFLLRLLFLAALIIVVWRVLGARLFWERLDPATRVLRERYARGEISEDEYRKRLATLA